MTRIAALFLLLTACGNATYRFETRHYCESLPENQRAKCFDDFHEDAGKAIDLAGDNNGNNNSEAIP